MWLLAVAVLVLAGCGGGDGGGLGGSAEVVELAATALTVADEGPLVWIAEEFRLPAGGELEHSHELAFVYVRTGRHGLELQERQRALEPGKSVAVPAGVLHRHVATASSASTFWEIRLAAPATKTPPAAKRIFVSEPLEGVPAPARASFLLVRIPPGGETSVHTHPGPELIYQLTGKILYQNALIGTVELGPGGVEGIPPGTAVQKRNRSDASAEFLSWFLVDPDEPFAPSADFPDE